MIISKLKRAVLITALTASVVTPMAAHAGDIAGAGCLNDRVLARHTDIFSMQFAPNQPAVVALRGDGDTDLDLQIIDPAGRTVCAAVGTSDREQCSWQPTTAGVTQVRIINLGNVFNAYRLCTN